MVKTNSGATTFLMIQKDCENNEDLGPVLQRVDINRNLFAIDINRNYVHKR